MIRFWLGILLLSLSLAGMNMALYPPTSEYSASSSVSQGTLRTSKNFWINHDQVLELADEEEALRKECKVRFLPGGPTPTLIFYIHNILDDAEMPYTDVHHPFTPSDKMGVFCYTRRLRI